MTVLEAIQKSTEFLTKKGVDSPRLQSELLLAGVLKTERLKLYLDFGRELAAEETALLREWVKRRGEREPLQHILGVTCFWGFEIRVNREVLIPRPETELLAEQGWMFLNGLCDRGIAAPAFLDFGVGSGCISIAIARKCPAARGFGMDVSESALEVARANLRASELDGRIELIQTESLRESRGRLPQEGVDLLVSNPPYIPSGEIPHLQEEVRRFDPALALDGGVDGLDFYRMLAVEGKGVLKEEGRLMVEFGDGQEDALVELFEESGWGVEAVLPDLAGKARMLRAHKSKVASG